MKEILLTRGFVALVDDEDYESLSRFKWYAHPGGRSVWYAARGSKNRVLFMHTQLLVAKGAMHLDGNGLNNQRHNLKKGSQAKNLQGVCTKRKGSSSRFRGVSFRSDISKWRAYLRVNGRQITVGFFLSEKKAAKARDRVAVKYWGTDCQTNMDKKAL